MAGLQRSTPLYYPDEYIYSTLARSIADTGLPSLRGSGALHFPAVLGPYLMAPWWLVSDVGRAYHLVVAAGGVAFSATVFPAYALARRVGITAAGSLLVAVLVILVPDAAFATCALTESYAYPLFVTTVLVMIDAVTSPTRRRQVAALALIGGLCLLRAQFVVLPVAYVIATVLQSKASWREWRAHRATIGIVVIGVIAAVAGARYYTGLGSHWRSAFSIWPWMAIDLLVLGVAAGWALVPAAVIGLKDLAASSQPRYRVFAVIAISTTALIVLQAAYFDTIQHRIHERYTFYAVPLLAVAALFGLQSTQQRSRYVLLAYGLAVAAVLVPATTWFRDADPSQAPSVLALQTFGTGAATLVWAVSLAVIAVLVARVRTVRWVPIALALFIAAALCIGGTRALLRYAPIAHPGGRSNIDLYALDAPTGSAIVTWAGTDGYVLMKTLFWTRGIKRVLVLGGGPAADGYGSESARFGLRGITDLSGRPTKGPFAFDLDTTAVVGPSASAPWLPRSPQGLILELTRPEGYLGTGAQVLVAPSTRPRALIFGLKSSYGRKQLTFACGRERFRVNVGSSEVHVRLPVPVSKVGRCRISLTRGPAVDHDGSIVSGVQVKHLALVPTTSPS
jgi:hypothetical protein